MVKTGLKIYKNNIWHFFTILGFVALGLIIAVSIIIPAMSDTIKKSADDIAKLCTHQFNFDGFFGSLYDQFKAMDWKNPFTTLQQVFTQSKLVEIFTKATLAAGVKMEDINNFLPTINACATNVVNSSITQLQVLIISLASCSIIGYVLIKSVVHFKSTKNHNLIKYIFNLIANILFITLIGYLFFITAQSTDGAALWFSLIGITLFQLIGELTISFITYAKKGMHYKDIVNLKTVIGSGLTNLVIVFISFAIIGIIYPFNQLAAIMIAIPLLLITTIIMDTVTNTFVTNYSKNSIK